MNTTDVTGKFTAEEIGNPIERNRMVDMISKAPKGGIIHVHAYESKGGHGEVANYFYLKGVDYGKMKERSLDKLNVIAEDGNFSIRVTRGVWEDASGKQHNRKAKGRTYKTVSKTYTHADAIVSQAISEIEQAILNPYKKGASYQKEGNGVYSQEDGKLHLRDCQLVHKVVLRQGDYPKKATSEKVALRDAIKRLLPISKYRQVVLDGSFDYITIGGQIIMKDEYTNNVYVGFSEHKGLLVPRITGLEEELPPQKVPTETLEPTEEQKQVIAEQKEMISDIFEV